jgi:hypothetical protein
MKQKLMLALLTIITFASCKKNEIKDVEINQSNENFIVRKDNVFPDGVLQFKTTEIFKQFWNKIVKDAHYVNKVTDNFKTFRNQIDRANQNNTNSFTNNSTSNNTVSVDSSEFINDMKEYTLPDSAFAGIVNTNMQIIVADTLYQFTRIGMIKVGIAYLSDYVTFYNNNKDQIFFDSNYVRVPTEFTLPNGDFQIQNGIVRSEIPSSDILNQRLQYIDDGGGSTGGGGGGGNGNTNYYVNSTVGSGFNQEIGILFTDWDKRRLVFNTKKTNFSILGVQFNIVGIKAKVQREKRFLWFTYWGPSYADELIVGCDNMDLETNYVYPTPQQFSAMTRPTFNGLANYTIGNKVLTALDINVKISALGYSLNNSQIAGFINSQFNSLVGNTYQNLFVSFENNFLNSIDPTYISSYAAYTKKINSINEANKMRWRFGFVEQAQGYSHENTWLFDYYFAYNQPTLSYDMMSGSFFCRARVGNIWHGIRIIRQ